MASADAALAVLDTDAGRALAAAAESGVPVEIESQRGESSTVFANPDGSLRMDLSNVPVRVRRSGTWQPIDTNLVPGADGSLAPRMAAIGLRISGGGDGALVRLDRGGTALELDAPFTLPVPTVAGDTATYAEVLPGVDLVVEAAPDTVAERLVVKSAEAASNPALGTLAFTTRTTNLTLRAGAGATIEAVDDVGTPVFTAPAPIMWDSRSTSPSPVAATRATHLSADDAEPLAPADPEADNTSQPSESNQVATVRADLGDGSLTMTPDLDLLRGPDTTYPVYIDPTFGSDAKKNTWAMVDKTYPSQEYWKWSGDKQHAEGMGYIDDALSGKHTKRLFYQFVTSSLNGKTIYDATLTTHETHAYSCTASKVEAWHSGSVSSSTNWDNQPGDVKSTSTGLQDAKTVASGRAECTPGGKDVAFDVTPAVSYQARHGAATSTIKLKAASESSQSGWKRFENAATLSVVYNTPPPAPSGLSTIEPKTSCVAGSSRPIIPNDPPKLVATISDADGGENVQGSFELADATGKVLKTYLAPASAPGKSQIYDLQAAYPLPAGLPEGTYKWRVRTKDPKVYGPYSGWCEFMVDKTAPKPPTLTASADTQKLLDANEPFPYDTDAVFTVASSDTSARTYRFSVNSGVPTSASYTLATSPSFPVRMNVYGPVVVRAWTYDQAGNQSAPAQPDPITVGGVDLTRDLRGRWRMDAPSGSVAPDTVGVTSTAPNGASPLALSGGAAFVTMGHLADGVTVDGALRLATAGSATATAVTTSTSTVDLTKNVTLTAWVRLSDTDKRAVVMSHDAPGGANVVVEERPVQVTEVDPVTGESTLVPTRHFFASVRLAGKAQPFEVELPVGVAFETWYHVAASWAPGERELVLDVADDDGVRLGAVTDDADSDGDVQAGAFRLGGATTAAGSRDAYWPGVVDEVAIFGNILPTPQLDQWRTAPHG